MMSSMLSGSTPYCSRSSSADVATRAGSRGPRSSPSVSSRWALVAVDAVELDQDVLVCRRGVDRRGLVGERSEVGARLRQRLCVGEKHRRLLSWVDCRPSPVRRVGSPDGRGCAVDEGRAACRMGRIRLSRAADCLATASMRRPPQHVGADELLEVAAGGRRSRSRRRVPTAVSPGQTVCRVGRSRSRRVPQIATQSRSRCVASAKSRIHAIGAEGDRGLVVAAEPVGVQGGEFPDELVVAVPVRRNDRRRQPEGDLQPGHPRRRGHATRARRPRSRAGSS